MSVGMAYVTCGSQAGGKIDIERAGKPKQGRSEQRESPDVLRLVGRRVGCGALGVVLLVYYLVVGRWV